MRVVLDLSMVGGICILLLLFKIYDYLYGKKYKLLVYYIFLWVCIYLYFRLMY